MRLISSRFNFHSTIALAILRMDRNNTIYIADIRNGENAKGLGSALLESIIQFSEMQGIEAIYGYLVPESKAHLQRLIRFYLKFGFALSTTLNHQQLEIPICLHERADHGEPKETSPDL